MFVIIGFLCIIFYLGLMKFITRRTNAVACLVGKTALVTGGNAGIGYTTCLLLASRGCRVIIADKDNGEKSRDEIIKKTRNPKISYIYLDLSSLQNVREFCANIMKAEEKIDILINNAGIGSHKEKRTTDGLVAVMQVNYYRAFLLTHLLTKLLKASTSARIIFLSSMLMFLHQVTIDNLDVAIFYKSSFLNDIQNYCNSKFCGALAAQEFAKRLKIPVFSVDPQTVKTQIFTKANENHHSFIWRITVAIYLSIIGVDTFTGVQTILHLATSDEVMNGGQTHYACLRPFFKPFALKNERFCEAIWKKTEELVKLKEDEKLSI